MSIAPGSRLGPYEIVSLLGAGGMGEVFRARDTKLNREVAIKVLPAGFGEDRDRVARFRREAQVVASLNHPNIAAIYGLEETGGTVALALELVDGEDLSQRLARGAIPVDEAIAIARQIAEGLEAAHERGVVHRDLKPANVKLTRDGAVKILDFGLAKAYEGDPGSSDAGLTQSPTMSRHMTEAGMILGTAAYMSPEQARGRPVDKRADIWSFGVVVYEMLAGRRLFAGETVSDTLAAVLRQDVDLASLPKETPGGVHRLLRRCLDRDPKSRLRDIGDARFELCATEPAAAPSAQSPVRGPSRVLVFLLAAAAIASTAVAAWQLRARKAPAPRTHLSIALPEGLSLVSIPAISRDGRRVTFVASDGVASPKLWIRELSEAEPRLLPGTGEASQPFFSPDGQWVAFYARNQLLKVSVEGGAPVALADSTSRYGGTWTDAGTLVFKKTWNGGLQVVGENGGEAKSLVDTAPGEYAYVWPTALPGGRELVFDVWGKKFEAVVLDMKTMKRRTAAGGWWRRLVFVPPGYLIGGRSAGELAAVRVPAAGEAAGNEAAVQKGVDLGAESGGSRFDVSWNGTLVYVREAAGGRWLATVSRRGEATRLPVGEVGDVQALRVSPDGRRAVGASGLRIGVLDLERGTVTPLLPELQGQSGAQSAPLWSPDGRSVTFASNHEGNFNLYSKPASGAGEMVTLVRRPEDDGPESYAPDGTLLFLTTSAGTGADLWILPPGGEPRPWLATAAEEVDARFSPDGRAVAYASNASGRYEVYVQSRDNAVDRVQVSADGGSTPIWSRTGDRIFFRQGNLVMEAAIRMAGGLSAAAPVRLFDGGWTLTAPFELMPDGERFLMLERPREAVPTRIEVVQGWLDDVKAKVPSR